MKPAKKARREAAAAFGQRGDVLRGRVLCCSKDLFTIQRVENHIPAPDIYQCSIKGKVLRQSERCYNPACPGDIALFTPEAAGRGGRGRLLAVEARRSVFSRFNEKGRCSQPLAANIDQVLVTGSLAHPPFRPRFIDRVLIQCEHAGIEGIVVINKCDLHDALTPEIERRLAGFAALGYTVLRVSAKTGAGLDVLRAALARKTSVFTGHSGAGKSSLINALFPSARQKTGELAAKYDRGAHTTVMAALFDGLLDGENAAIIDTPGLRRFVPDGLDRRALVRSMRDLSPLAEYCLYGASCTHTSENGCALLAALDAGTLCPDRWATYQNLRESLPAASFQ